MSTSPAVASVVIPAHNEAEGIARTLETLTRDAHVGEFEIVVVCNGCSDATAQVAASVPGVEVVEIAEPSKLAALRAGDERAVSFPRVYLDADILVPTETVRALAQALSGEEALVGGVPGRLDLRATRGLVKLYFEFRQRLPVFHDGGIGAGVYALSERGRSRFDVWPDLRSGDDQFIFRLFSSEERITLSEHHTVVEPPSSLRAVVRRGVRTARGNARLSAGAAGRDLPAPPAGRRVALRDAARSPRGIASAAVFIAVTAVVRLRARFGRGGGDWLAR